MFRVYNPVFNLGFRVHSFQPTKATFSSHFLIRKNETDLLRRVVRFEREVRGGGAGERDMTNLITEKEQNDGFAESNASPPCNDCGVGLNLGQRILNSKRIEGAKLCGRCHGKELKAWKNGEFVAHDGKEYEGKQPRWNEPERRERERERRKHKKETNHVMFSGVLGGSVPAKDYRKEMYKRKKETGHKVESNALGGRIVPFNVYGNEMNKQMRKRWKETGHVMKSKALGGRDVPYNVYGKLMTRVKKKRILREMQAHESMNRSSCANSGCDCRVSPTWFTLSNMESELILRCELAGITRTKEQFRRKLERMFTVVSTAMKKNEEMYFCLECKEKEFSKVGKRLQRVDEK